MGAKTQLEFQDEASGRKTQLPSERGKSLLAIALENGIAIEHTCGGVGACSTCHVHILEGQVLLNPASDAELDQVEQAPGFSPDSRLACQATVVSAGTVRCIIPKWNRNAVKEAGR